MADRDWVRIATHIDQRRTGYIQLGQDYATASANAFRDELHGLADAADQIDAYGHDVDRWMNRATEAELEAGRLTRLLDLTAAARMAAVIDTINAVPQQKTATHHDTCWQKHTGCLAARIRREIGGEA